MEWFWNKQIDKQKLLVCMYTCCSFIRFIHSFIHSFIDSFSERHSLIDAVCLEHSQCWCCRVWESYRQVSTDDHWYKRERWRSLLCTDLCILGCDVDCDQCFFSWVFSLPCDALRCTVFVIVILSVCLSVRLPVCHTRGLCPHGSTYDHDFFTIW